MYTVYYTTVNILINIRRTISKSERFLVPTFTPSFLKNIFMMFFLNILPIGKFVLLFAQGRQTKIPDKK